MGSDISMLIVSFICIIFFFKQKTAYEMRISDWSSDVCSSDLQGFPQFQADPAAERGSGLVEARIVIVLRHLVEAERKVVPRADPFCRIDGAGLQRLENLAGRQRNGGAEIGRAHV